MSEKLCGIYIDFEDEEGITIDFIRKIVKSIAQCKSYKLYCYEDYNTECVLGARNREEALKVFVSSAKGFSDKESAIKFFKPFKDLSIQL